MRNILSERNLTIINFIIVSYFVLIYIINYFEVDNTIINVFREILTLPFLLGQLLFLIAGIFFLIKTKNARHLTKISLILLAISTLITIGSFFKISST
jgi:hypothetical protein